MKRRLILLILIAASSLSLFSAIYYCLPSAGSAAAAANNEILINEVELNPPGTDSGAEKVELYNPSSSSIDVNGWTISSTAGRTSATIVINEGTTTTTIPPKGYLIVGGGDSQQWLDNTGGEAIELRNDSGIPIDYVGLFSDVANDDGTWQRSPDGEEDNWVFSSNTLGGANFGTLVSDPEVPLPPLAPEHPIIAQQEKKEEEEASSLPAATTATTATNSSVEVAVTPAIQPSQNLTIAFIDVGQGDSILIILPNTKTLLIDGGERDGYGKVLATLHEHALSNIDVVVATHPHADHIGGLVEVIKNVDVGEVLDSGQVHTTQTFEDFLDAIETKRIPLKAVRQGDSINLDPTVKIDVLNPPVNLLDGADNEAEFNDNSVVLKLTYGEFSALLTGDMEERNEARLVSEKNTTTALDADVLKAGHHGSRTSSSLSFLNAVTPEVVIISLGSGNTYGHPHQEALDRISAAGVEHLFRTDVDGTITLTVNGSSGEYYSILTESNGKTITTSVVVVDDYGISESDMAYAAPNSSVNLIAAAYIQGY